MQQPGWEGSLGENGYMYTYGWVPLLSTWNYHKIVNWLYPNTIEKVKKCCCKAASKRHSPTKSDKIHSMTATLNEENSQGKS